MKQKKSSSEAITKQYLDSRFENFVTAFRNEMQFNSNLLLEEIRNQISQMKNQLYTLTDPVLKDIEIRREERELERYHTDELRKKIGNHEKRIVKLEKRAT